MRWLALALCVVLAPCARADVQSFVSATGRSGGGSGAVNVRHRSEAGFALAKVGQQLLAGSSVWTQKGATAQLHVGMNAVLNLEPGTMLTLTESRENAARVHRVSVEEGATWTTVVRGPFTVETPNGSATGSGAQLRVTFDKASGESVWELLSGRMTLTGVPDGKTTPMAPGDRTTLTQNGEVRTDASSRGGDTKLALGAFASTFGRPAPDGASAGADLNKKGGQSIFLIINHGGGPLGLLGPGVVRPGLLQTPLAPGQLPGHNVVVVHSALGLSGLTGFSGKSGSSTHGSAQASGQSATRLGTTIAPTDVRGASMSDGLINVVGERGGSSGATSVGADGSFGTSKGFDPSKVRLNSSLGTSNSFPTIKTIDGGFNNRFNSQSGFNTTRFGSASGRFGR